jgi:hypothetical protein
MTKRIREFLDHIPKLPPKVHRNDFHCQTCGISNTSSECCLFEKICNSFTENNMQSQVHAPDPNKVSARCCLFATAL